MFRIRTITGDHYPRDKAAVEQVKEILLSHFPSVGRKKFDEISEHLRDPIKYRFSIKLFVAENFSGLVKGLALLYHAPDINFCFLDYIATRKEIVSGGIGGALYQKVREVSIELESIGLFFECLPDNFELCNDPLVVSDNKKRLRFYEKFGARPIVNTLYETPVKETDTCPPLLVYDNLEREIPLTGKDLRKIVAAILERKYKDFCPPDYVEKVIKSIKDGPVELRPNIYVRKDNKQNHTKEIPERQKIILVVNDKHAIHHVRERGYVESPVRIKSIRKEIDKTGLFSELKPFSFSEEYIRKVHANSLVN